MDKWLEATGLDAELAFRQFKGRTRPTEPANCPQHSTVQKTFLNPICEDCLLAEIQSLPVDGGANTDPPPPAPVPPSDNVEGLVWDSEVKVEIQSRTSQELSSSAPLTPISTVVSVSANDTDDDIDDIDRRILESHVEITIEDDNCSVSADDPASPLLTSSQNEDSSSPPSSIATSPESSTDADADKRYSTSPTLRTRRHEYKLHDQCPSDIGDTTDDEVGDAPRGRKYPQKAQPSRGRPPIRGGGDGIIAVRSVTDPVIPLVLDARKKSNKGLPRFKSIRTLSSSFRHTSKTTKTQDPVTTESDTVPKATSKAMPMPTRSRSRNPFRAFRRRKSSRNDHAETIETTPVLHHGRDFCDSFDDEQEQQQTYLEKEKQKPALPPPRKASQRNWRSFTDPEQQTQAQWENPSSSSLRHNERRGRARSRAPSPTGSWSQNHLDYNYRGEPEPELPRWEFGLPTHKDDIPFDTQSVFSDFEVEGTAGSALVVPGTPDSFKVHPLRARIEGIETFDLGFDLGLEITSPNKSQEKRKEEVCDMDDQACVVQEHVQVIGLGLAEAPEIETACETLSSELERASLESGEQLEEKQPQQEQGLVLLEPRPASKLLEPEQIVSLYGRPKEGDAKEQADIEDHVPKGEGVTQTVVPVEEVLEVDSGSTTPPGSPSPAYRDVLVLPTRPLHPPRKSSLRRLTGFNHAVMPFADFEFPMPVLGGSKTDTAADEEGRLSR
ncbi:hypothetical protein LTS15_002907 [Exophiala xenobiotica]|nr:hypothetical protein LTS15_002907 [Exophiala xenobiotica]